jgi:hypothetical protein
MMNIRTCFYETHKQNSAYFFQNIENLEKGGDAAELTKLTKEVYQNHKKEMLTRYDLNSAYDPITASELNNKREGKRNLSFSQFIERF